MGNSPAHLLAASEGVGALFAAGHLSVNGTTLTFTEIGSPKFFAGDITALRVAAGRYQVTLNNFRGPQGFVFPTITVGSTSTAALGITAVPGLSSGISLNSYTTGTDIFSFTIGITSGNTFTDADVFFQVFAF